MKHPLLRVCVSAAITVFSWYLFLFLAGYAASFGDAWLDEGRIWPYSHAHLGEEYSEGNYFPLLDPLFITAAFVRDYLAFCLGTAFLTRITTHLSWVGANFLLSIGIIYILQFGLRFPCMLQALAVEGVFVLMGVAVATYIRKTSAHETAS